HLISSELEQEIKNEIGFKGDITEIPKSYGMSQAERLDRLTQLVLLAERLIEAITAHLLEIPEGERRARITSAAEILHRILNEQTEETTSEDGMVKRKKKDKKDKPKDRIASPVDPDARHGHKTSKKPFLGYKVSLTQNVNEIITNVEVDPGNFGDGGAQIPMCDELEDRQGKRPKKVTGDKAYGDGKARQIQKEKGTRIVAPLKKPAARKGKFPRSMFNYNPETGEVTCPGDKKARMIGYNKKYKCTMYKFSVDDCGKCPIRDLCTDAKARSTSVSDFEPLFREAAEYNKTDEYKDDMKRRAGHERKNCEMKKKHGMERARYWGVAKVRIQAYLTAMTVNIKRFIKLLCGGDRKKTQLANVL
ncbi:transposase, partial [bacterium]|nr:transposase [bacterium]